MTTALATLDHFTFRGDTLQIVRMSDGDVGVAFRPLVEDVFGLDFPSQHKRMQRTAALGALWATVVIMTTVGADGKRRQMLVLPRASLPMFAATLDASRVREEIRGKLIGYQNDAARVLAEHYLSKVTPGALGLDEIRALLHEHHEHQMERLQAEVRAAVQPHEEHVAGLALRVQHLERGGLAVALPSEAADRHGSTIPHATLVRGLFQAGPEHTPAVRRFLETAASATETASAAVKKAETAIEIRKRVQVAKEKGVRIGRVGLTVDLSKVRVLWIEGCPLARIAEKMGISLSTLKRALKKARLRVADFGPLKKGKKTLVVTPRPKKKAGTKSAKKRPGRSRSLPAREERIG